MDLEDIPSEFHNLVDDEAIPWASILKAFDKHKKKSISPFAAFTDTVIYIASKEIIILVSISTLLAWPAIFYIARNWLQNYHYKITLNVFDFLIGFIIALTIAVITISYRTLKSARLNPAKSLRYE